MNVLIQGGESLQRLNLLLSLTKFSSNSMQQALIDYYVKGHQKDITVVMNSIDKGNFSRAQKRLEQVAFTVEQIKELDWGKR